MVPVLDQRLIHLLSRPKGAVFVSEHIPVPEMGICGKVDHCFLQFPGRGGSPIPMDLQEKPFEIHGTRPLHVLLKLLGGLKGTIWIV